jgi:hypothetical protein
LPPTKRMLREGIALDVRSSRGTLRRRVLAWCFVANLSMLKVGVLPGANGDDEHSDLAPSTQLVPPCDAISV